MRNTRETGIAALLLLVSLAQTNGMILSDSLTRDSAAYSPVYDFIPEHNYELVADQMTCITEEIPLTFNSRVYGFINYFGVRNREYTRGILKKKDIYFPLFEKYLAKYEMPDELKYLSIVESGLEPRAISRAGAGGLWQFMPYTGRSYGLHQDFYIDERFDPDAATEAACKYLKMLYNMFGDWELALAAYNSGPGNVRKAIRKSGYQKGFWNVYRYLPRETRSYVPQFVAIIYVINYADDYNLNSPDLEYMLESDTLLVSDFINLKLLASEINVCYEDLDRLNPAIKRFALPAAIKKYAIRIPIDKIEFARENRTSILANASKSGQNELKLLAKNTHGSTYGRTKVVHRVRSGDVLGKIAQNYHVRISDIKKWNNLSGNMIRIGQRLNIWLLPSSKYTSSASVSPTHDIQKQIQTTSGNIYNVQPGDTLWDISRKYDGLSIEKIKKLNNLKSNKIKPGQKLIIG